MKRILFSFLAACLTIFLVVIIAIGCSDDDPVSSTPVPAKVLILEDGGTEDSLQFILDSAGFDVTMGGLYLAYTGTDFSTYDLVILLNGLAFNTPMPDSVQQGLKSYVMAGGVLLTTEWFVYYGKNVILDSLSPVTSGQIFNDGPETHIKELDHPITAGLPDTFYTHPSDWYWYATADRATSLSSNRRVLTSGVVANSAQLVIGTFGSGRVIYWAMAGIYNGPDVWSTEVRRIFINIAAFSKTI